MNPEGMPGEKIEELLERLLDRPFSFAETRRDFSALPGPNQGCPEDGVWPAIASGQSGKHDDRQLIDHAAGCRRCGALLAYWANILSEEESPEEAVALARLSSQSSGWQRSLIARLSGVRLTEPGSLLRRGGAWPALLAVAGAIAAGTIFFLFLSNSHPQASPEKLLAEAYAGHRMMDLRIPMAGFASLDATHHTRGSGGGPASEPVPLLEARAAITQALMKTPEDPHWLLLQARADILNENYDPAIDTLKRLLSTDATNVSVLTDLASAYTMRSKATDVATDEVTALDYLEQASRLDAKNPVVLYNKAVVLQELYQYSNAVDVWHRFLAVEHDRAWLADGQRRLAEIKAREAKVKAQQSRLDPFLTSPDGMLHLARSPALVTEYDEELSTDLLPHLLRAAFPLPPVDSPAIAPEHISDDCPAACRAARELLKTVAASLSENHHDRWLEEFLHVPVTREFQAAANSLADAIAAGSHANPADALKAARSAEQGFVASGSTAGVAFARVEQMYNLEHLRGVRDCLATAKALSSILAAHRYPMFEAKFWIDDAGCEGLQDDFGALSARLGRALQVSSEARYRVAHLRAASFAAAAEGTLGNRDKTWSMNLELLKTYWDGDYPVIRILMPYSSLADAEQESSHLYAAVVLRREAWRASATSSSPVIVNENHFLLFKAEIRAGETAEATRELDAAETERAAVPGHDSLQGSAADISIYLAEAYLRQGQLAASERMLKAAATYMAGTSDRDMQLRSATASGHLALLERHNSKADEELSRAVKLAERGYREARGAQERTGWIRNAREVYAALTLLRVREGRPPLEALAIWERYRILSSGTALDEWCHDTDLDCLVEPLAAARKALGQATVLGTIRLDRSMLLWTMDDRGIEMHEVKIDPDRFDLLCHTFSETLATPASSEESIRFYGSRIANALLTPAGVAFDPGRLLVFDLDDSMEFLPIGALPVNGGYLGLRFATSTIRSLLLASRPPAPSSAAKGSLVVGASDPEDAGVSRLPEAKSEAMAVAEFLIRPRVFVGSDAVASSIEAAAPRAALIHFAGHTSFADGGTRLLLARPSNKGPAWLDARAFRSHDFANCRLVVLSACSTGKREERAFGDIQDIVEALTAEGAQQIVATHWDVDSTASTSLMKEFYAGLARGLTVPQALLKAEAAVSAAPEYRHPYYWAPYYVTGMNSSNLKELLRNERTSVDAIRNN